MELSKAKKQLKLEFRNDALGHINTLTLQGSSISSIIDNLSSASIKMWSTCINTLTTTLFNFTRKALQLQLPTLSNLIRWKKATSSNCPLCNQIQSNKHVLNNCSSSSMLENYKARHDAILLILARWLESSLDPSLTLYVDLPDFNQNKTHEIFNSLRPDITVLSSSGRVYIWELTICHESNLLKSKNYKLQKYARLKDDLKPQFSACEVHTIEVSSLGLINDNGSFTMKTTHHLLLVDVSNNITKTIIGRSYNIYLIRNVIP